MATETLDPNGGTGYGDVSDGDDATYWEGGTLYAAQWWAIKIDGTTIYDDDVEPGANNNSTSLVNLTRVINSTNFSGCPTITKALITSLEIGMKSGTGPSQASVLFELDNPSFPADATINSVTINGRLSFVSYKTRIHEISLVVDYTEVIPPTLLKIKSGTLTLKSGNLTIK
jgi:hypothetical protein